MKIIRTFILGLFSFLMLLSCQTVYYFGAEPIKKSENDLNVWFFLDTIKPNIKIDFINNSNNPIINFELKNWYIKIGEDFYEFDLNNMYFSGTELETGYFITLFENGKYDFESINKWNQKYQNEYEKKTKNFQYKFRMTRYVEKDLSEKIRENNISNLKVHLEYSYMLNNRINNHIIDEEFNITIKKGYLTIFHILNPANY